MAWESLKSSANTPIAEFTDRVRWLGQTRSYRQNTAEVNLDYIIKQFDARVMASTRTRVSTRVQTNTWEAGVGLQLQISKQILVSIRERAIGEL